MTEQTVWTGLVAANLEQGQKTGVMLKKGDVISVVASGYVRFGADDTHWANPAAPIPLFYNEDNRILKLVALLGNDPTQYTIGTGVINWTVPADGELTFLFADTPGLYWKNSGAFDVTVRKNLVVAYIEQ